MAETEADRFRVLWRVPARGERILSLEPGLPEHCQTSGVSTMNQDGARAERLSEVICPGGLDGAVIAIVGLQRLRTDVLVRVTYLNGGTETLRATPENPRVTLQGRRDLAEVAGTYLVLGVEHILLGIDHLLFVLALLLLVTGWKRLVGTVTAFTLAHSITLAGATLGVLSAPAALIEALIALSIVFVAAEAIHAQRGKASMLAQRPWVIAFAFGLLHGFGFAGALSEVGLPSEAIPTALLFFNLGVEVGQLIFIASIAAVVFVSARLIASLEPSARFATAYGIGSVAAFWTFERVIGAFA
jgi:hydrogenase/urease accessory protein HupE